eukprot:91861-Prymnesium_polylepis.1
MREAAPTHSPHSPHRRDAAITRTARSRLGYATQGRVRACHAWQQALSAGGTSAQKRTSDVSTTLTLG